jgi:hypothetical protein
VFRRVCGKLLSKGRQWIFTCKIAALGWEPGQEDSRGVAWRGVPRRDEDNGTTGDCLGLTVLSLVVLVLLLTIGGIEKNPGPVVETENTFHLLCTGCGI